ncbi:MAG: tetratricopeptide repeat protein [Dysgonamonadaceae bacterium]|jgi:tetratricopeptide (TPR) repeat protein|nr:tetratricopeptide repeat protein [Dysgonamonadaceae bacterium]
MKYVLLLLIFITGFSGKVFSQKEVRKDIRSGNKEYRKEKYAEAEVNYRKALKNNARSAIAAYDLGNALYKQEKGKEALEQYQAAINNESDSVASKYRKKIKNDRLSAAWHNSGNVFMTAKDYAKSIEAYKQALRINPHDDETRYNLALAQKMLQNQQNQDQNQDQNKDKDQEKQQDQQKQEQQQQEQQKQEQQQQEQQEQNQMSKQSAEQILEALMQDEKDTQEKVKAQQMKQQKRKKTDKNW